MGVFCWVFLVYTRGVFEGFWDVCESTLMTGSFFVVLHHLNTLQRTVVQFFF